MVRREELLGLLEQNNADDIIKFVIQCRADGASVLSDTLASCSKKQLDYLWDRVYTTFSQCLLVIPEDLDSEDGEQTIKVVECVTGLLAAMLAQKEVHVPEGMIQVASVLQDVLPGMPVSKDKVKNNVTRVFEDWWKKGLPNKEGLVMSSFVYIVGRSLDLRPKPLVADLKRVWSLHEVVQLIEMNNESSNEFKTLLLRCVISPQYMQHDEGIKFLGYILTLDERFTGLIHTTIKNHLLSVPRSWYVKYGEIYFRAWQSGSVTQKIEQDCIQDLIYHAVHAQPALAPALKKVLSYIHGQKKQRDVDDLLFRLYEPIIWRSLTAANSQVRANSAALFCEIFPLQSPELSVKESDDLIQKQFEQFQKMLEDPFPNIRSLSVLGVFRVMEKYWEMIPQDTLKSLTVKLVQDNLADSSSADVRESVLKGLAILLDNPLCHLFLKPVLPEIRNSFHDVSEKVRVAMLELLKKVKSLRTIKYWNVVPIEHLLARLAVDSDPVNRRIMTLIFSSFVPIDASNDEQLDRCIALIQSNPVAARQFFRYAPQHMSLTDTVSYISMLCKAVLASMRKAGVFQDRNNTNQENMSDESSVKESDIDDVDDDDGDDLKISNTPLMKGLFEAICILWTVSDSQLKKASNAQLNKALQKRFSYALPEMIKAFTDPEIICVLVQIAAFLPANYIPTLSRTWLPKLRNMTADNKEEDFAVLLESLCRNGRGAEVIELLTEWLSTELGENDEHVPVKKTKKKKVGFVEPKVAQPQLALNMLSYLQKDSVTQDILLRDHTQDIANVKNILKQCLGKIENLLGGGSSQVNTDHSLMTASFTLYCKLTLLLHSKDSIGYSCVQEFEELLGWTDKHALPVLGVKLEADCDAEKQANRKLVYDIICVLLNIFNTMMLLGVGDSSLCNKLVDFCTSCLVADQDLELLPLAMLCIYQVTEFLQYQSEQTEELNNTISNAFSRILIIIAGYVKNNEVNSRKLLGNIKAHVGELIKVIFGPLPLDSTLVHDVMGTILAAVLAELSSYSQNDDLAESPSFDTLPPLSGWLLDILTKKKHLNKFFLDELIDCAESGAISDLHKMHGTIQLLCCAATCKSSENETKELLTIINKQMDTLKEGLTEEGKDDLRSVILALEEKLKNCQQDIQVVES
ncbi:condensin-2 complex subunit G2-like [Ruditapes philippinarum]|uniref:condensin-2 complex subunit G2-like n=1 Tax=Ruditapes philippinarum TaxID=129788 RepID=UPI00295AE0FE|nr:condensin-2 complex subunit G2-like [Ruditapes philippinarum]XP_060579914.1 condensin-2 complex subunit G2-like [Ruditapes philippinarum]